MLDLLGINQLAWLLGAVAAGIVAVWGMVIRAKMQGRAEADADATRDTLRRVQDGQRAAQRGQDGRTPDQRLRDNDGAWQ